MSHRVLIRETISIIALFAFFLMVLVVIVGLAYYLEEIAASAVREFLGATEIAKIFSTFC